MDFKTQLKVSLPSLIVSSIVGIGMAYSGYGVWSLVFSAVVRSVLNSTQLWFWSKWTPLWSFSILKFKYHIGYGSKFLFSSILDIAFNNAYAILIGKYFAPAQIGYYNRADTLQQLPVLNIANVLNKVTFPLFVKIQDDDVRLRMVYSKIMKMVIFLVAPILIIMGFLAEPLFRFLFTEKWLPAVPFFQILCVNGILFPIHSYNLAILKVKGYSSLSLKLEVVKKIIIVCIVATGFQFGISGLLYGGVIASFLAFFINTHYCGKFINYSSWSQIKDLVPTIFLAGVAGLGAYGIDYALEVVNSNDFFRLLFGGLAGVAVYLSLAFIFQLDAYKEVKSIIFKR
jgi:O-antigen/teichoic acid export membrane protein